MVNRVLIRMKVVQMLYSYLLTKNDFKIKAAPEHPTKDRTFAHIIYTDTLLFLLQLAGYKATSDGAKTGLPTNNRFHDSRMMQALASNEQVRSLILRDATSVNALRPALLPVYNAIVSSDIYKRYLRARIRGPKEDVEFWTVIIETVIKPSAAFADAARTIDGFTLKGLEGGLDDVADTLREYSDERNTLTAARNALTASLDKAYELYHALLALPVEITRAYEERLEAGRNKFLPSATDLNPNTKLLDNKLIGILDSDEAIKDFAEEHPGMWADSPELISRFLDKILRSQIYADYIALAEPTRTEDVEFWRNVIKNLILPDEELAEVLENKSIFWNDDLEIMSTFALKTLKRLAADSDKGANAVLPQYKDEEDRDFGPALFMDVVANGDSYRELIDRFVAGRDWDTERLAFMDVVIMLTAISEIVNFPNIPIPVTLNEYIEIANSYSTPKSGRFINGVLFAVINQLREDGKILR